MLEREGYGVHEARHGADALRIWRQHRAAIAAVVTDVRMPELGGRALADALRAEAPTLPIVFMSGYADEGAGGMLADGETLVPKPFTADALLDAVAGVLRPDGD
jgi:CheY-like chemotaxis protein